MNAAPATVTFVTGLLLCAGAGAQTITWGPALPSLGAADMSQNGSLVAARNLHGSNISATVNGAVFSNFQPNGWNGYVTNGLNGSTTGDAGYDDLLNGARAMTNGSTGNPTGWGGIRIDDLATLTPGATYEIQCWFTDQRTGTSTNVLYDRVMTLSSVWGAVNVTNGEVTNVPSLLQGPLSQPLDADPDDAPAVNSPDLEFGMHCTGTFVYVPGGETWLIVQGSHPLASNVLRPHLTALQIRDVTLAAFLTTGTGCPSSVGVATLSASSMPVIGGTLQVDMDNLAPAAVPLMAAGFAAIAPLPLTTVGLSTDPSCVLTTDFAVIAGPLSVVGGTASLALPIPSLPALVGGELFFQGAQLEAAGVSLTAQGIGRIGL